MQPSPLPNPIPETGASRVASPAAIGRRGLAAGPAESFAEVLFSATRPAQAPTDDPRTQDPSRRTPASEPADRHEAGRAAERIRDERAETRVRSREEREDEPVREHGPVEEETASAAAAAAPAPNASAPPARDDATEVDAEASAPVPPAATPVSPQASSGEVPADPAEAPAGPPLPPELPQAPTGASTPARTTAGTQAAESQPSASGPNAAVPPTLVPVDPALAEATLGSVPGATEGKALPVPDGPAEDALPPVPTPLPAGAPALSADDLAPAGAANVPPTDPTALAVAAGAVAPAPAAESASAGDGSRTGANASGNAESPAPVGAQATEPARGADFAQALRRAGGPADAPRADRAETIERIVAATRLSVQRGETRLRMLLHPAHLGGLRIDLSVKDGVLDASLRAETHAARHALAANLDALRDSLAHQGIAVGHLEVSVWDDFPKDARGSHSSRDEASPHDAPLGRASAADPEPESLASVRRRLSLAAHRVDYTV